MTVTDIRPSRRRNQPSEAQERLRETASPREVAKAVEAMSTGMLRCRRMRQHKWEPSNAVKIRGGFQEWLACERCDAKKERLYNSRGSIVAYGEIEYPEGYLLVGLGRLDERGRDVINLASLQRDVVGER